MRAMQMSLISIRCWLDATLANNDKMTSFKISLEVIFLLFHGNVWRRFLFLKPIVSSLKICPKLRPFVALMSRIIVGGHAVRENVNTEEIVPVGERGIGEGVNLFNFGVGHGETAD